MSITVSNVLMTSMYCVIVPTVFDKQNRKVSKSKLLAKFGDLPCFMYTLLFCVIIQLVITCLG